jgi:hypothetical protein
MLSDNIPNPMFTQPLTGFLYRVYLSFLELFMAPSLGEHPWAGLIILLPWLIVLLTEQMHNVFLSTAPGGAGDDRRKLLT